MAALLNQKHEQFAQKVAGGMSATQAYIECGYSEKGAAGSASQLQNNPKVAKRIGELKEAIAKVATKHSGIDKAWVMQKLVEITKMGMAAEPVTDEEGNPIGEYKQNLAAANKSVELIGKELGMFIDRKEIRTGPLQDVPDEQLDAIIAEASRKAGIVYTKH
jgi:phage terminase small subunit